MDGRLRVLVVEDERLIAMQIEDDIADAGHEVVGSAMSSEEAVRIGREERPDFAFVDIHLVDGPSGIDVARALSAAEITVVFLTSNAKRIPADFAGAAAVLGKPVSTAALHGTLRYFAGGPDRDAAATPPRELTLAPG